MAAFLAFDGQVGSVMPEHRRLRGDDQKAAAGPWQVLVALECPGYQTLRPSRDDASTPVARLLPSYALLPRGCIRCLLD